jgi:hypothetical protein
LSLGRRFELLRGRVGLLPSPGLGFLSRDAGPFFRLRQPGTGVDLVSLAVLSYVPAPRCVCWWAVSAPGRCTRNHKRERLLVRGAEDWGANAKGSRRLIDSRKCRSLSPIRTTLSTFDPRETGEAEPYRAIGDCTPSAKVGCCPASRPNVSWSSRNRARQRTRAAEPSDRRRVLPP